MAVSPERYSEHSIRVGHNQYTLHGHGVVTMSSLFFIKVQLAVQLKPLLDGLLGFLGHRSA